MPYCDKMGQRIIQIKCIKEFIKRLKSGNLMVSYPEDKREYRKGWDDCVRKIVSKIDKLAGAELI